MTVGERIRAWREYYGVTLTVLAEAVGTDKGTFSRIENNKFRPRAETVEQVAGYLGLSMSEFYGPVPAAAS